MRRHSYVQDTVEIGEEEINVVVEYDYYAGCKGRMYMPNGDPGYPEEPAEVEITKIYAFADKSESDISAKIDNAEINRITDLIFEEERNGWYEW